MQALSLSELQPLTALARKSIQTYLLNKKRLRFETSAPSLCAPRGCFVTLWKKDMLRGCIGTFEASEALYQNVIRLSVAAAVDDPRFPPLDIEELNEIEIEISVLGDLEEIPSPKDIQLGRHGIYILSGNRSGTYLPDVALDQGWSAEEFVHHCATEKAHLDPKQMVDARLFRYEVIKIKEKK